MVKLTKRKGFNFFRSYYDVYNELETAEDKVAFIDALFDRQFLGVKPSTLKGMAKFAYISQTNSIDSQVKGYEDKTGTKLLPPPTVGVNKKDLTPTLQVQEEVQVQVEEKEEVQEKEKQQITIPKKQKVFSDEVFSCLSNCLKYFPEHLHPKNKISWLDTIGQLNRIDKIPFEKIIEIVKKTRGDNFWSTNFLSLTKLRKKNKDGVMYIVVFNEKFKSNERTNQQVFTDAMGSQTANDLKFG